MYAISIQFIRFALGTACPRAYRVHLNVHKLQDNQTDKSKIYFSSNSLSKWKGHSSVPQVSRKCLPDSFPLRQSVMISTKVGSKISFEQEKTSDQNNTEWIKKTIQYPIPEQHQQSPQPHSSPPPPSPSQNPMHSHSAPKPTGSIPVHHCLLDLFGHVIPW